MTAFTSEVDLAAPLVPYFEQRGHVVYQEVKGPVSGKTADLVAVSGAKLHVVEAKLSFGIQVVEQAIGWFGQAHRVSIAIPSPASRRIPAPRWAMLRRLGLGLLCVTPEAVLQVVEPRIERLATEHFLADAVGVQPTGWSGRAGGQGQAWSPFKSTCNQVLEYVRQANEPRGCLLREVVEQIQHHWGSDRMAEGRLRTLIKHGKVPGVFRRGEGRHYRVLLEEPQEVRRGA